jgi:hypothetical protein
MSQINIPLEATSLIYPVHAEDIPLTITLKSSNGSRKIEISTDGGVEYFIPVYDATSATMLVVSIATPITHIKVTGAIADIMIMVV